MAVVNKEIDKGGGSVEVGYSFNGTGCEGTIVSGRSSVTWLTVVANPTKNKLVISAPPNDGNERSGVIQVTVNGTDCPNNKIQVTQGGGDDFTVNGSSTDFSTTIDSCNGGGYNISISKDASFVINPNTNSVKINNGTEGNLNAGTYTITYDALSEGAEEQNTITFTHNGNTIVMTLIRTCNVVHDCTDCKSIFPDDDKLTYIGKESNFDTYELIPVIDGAGGDENEVIVRVLSTHCNASFARSVDSPWIKNGNDGIQVWVMCDGEYNCVRFNLQENPDAEAREGSVFIQWWNGDNENPIYQSCYRIKVKQGGKHSQTCNCSIIASGGGYPDEEHAAPFTGITNALGRFTSSCSVDDITPTVVDNVSWISDLSLSFYQGVFTVNGTIARNDGDKRNAYISLSTEDGQCGDLIPVYQKGYSCSFRITQTQYPSSNPAATHIGSPGPIGTCQTDCDVSTITTESDCFNNWVHDISFSQILSVDGTYFVIATIEDNTEDARDCTITFKNSKGDTYDTLKVYQKGNSSTQCDCTTAAIGNITNGLNIPAGHRAGVLISTFSGNSQCSKDDFRLVKESGDDIFRVENGSIVGVSIAKSGTAYTIHTTDYNDNTTTDTKEEVLIIQSKANAQKCGSFVVTQQGTGDTPVCIVELLVTASQSTVCGVNFKVETACDGIGQCDIIEWGYTRITDTNARFDNGQAFRASAGEAGITQVPGTLDSGSNPYHIWWRNRSATAVSGHSVVTLEPCPPTPPTKFSATVRIDQVEDSSMSPSSIDWGDGSITPVEKGVTYIHMYNDDTQDYTCTVFGNRKYIMNKDNHDVNVCDCVNLDNGGSHYYEVNFGSDGGEEYINVNQNECTGLYVAHAVVIGGSMSDPSLNYGEWANAEIVYDDRILRYVIKISAGENPSSQPRTATVTYGLADDTGSGVGHCGSIEVTQAGKCECSDISPLPTLEFDFYSDSKTVYTELVCDNLGELEIVWDGIHEDGWMTCEWVETGGLKVTVTDNTGYDYRGASINIKLKGSTTTCRTLNIHQHSQND